MEIRWYQRGNQKVPKGQPEGTNMTIRRNQRVRQKVPKG
jgi:hypothetical protein